MNNETPIHKLKEKLNNNNFYIKREDLLPFSFGGNKARKGLKFKEEIIRNNHDVIVTYGSSSSNHCRIIANMAVSLNIKCYIISPKENYKKTYNSELIKKFNAKIIKVPVEKVSETIEILMKKLSKNNNPYFIPGGGHGNLGTDAYVDCFNEICNYEKQNNTYFDYIFFASGTGTTHAGLVCGQILKKDYNKKIIGISIARNEERGRKIIEKSIEDYLDESIEKYEKIVNFTDKYTLGGYGITNKKINDLLIKFISENGIALNSTYTGKAYYGMMNYIKDNNIRNKNILFINTGGIPLFFDNLKELKK